MFVAYRRVAVQLAPSHSLTDDSVLETLVNLAQSTPILLPEISQSSKHLLSLKSSMLVKKEND